MSDSRNKKVGIIGAGIAGLAAARYLTDHGVDVVVLDKGRNPGGRASSRLQDDFSFDHGAQYFTARDPDFKLFTQACAKAGAVAEWQGRIVKLSPGATESLENQEPRWVGTPRMNALGHFMTTGLTVHNSIRITAMNRADDSWLLVDKAGKTWGPYDKLIMTLPTEQAADLIGDKSPLAATLRQIEMQPCWAVLCGFPQLLSVSFDGAFCHESILAWVCRNSSKPGRPDGESWVFHASREWTSANQGLAKDKVIASLMAEFERLTGASLPPASHTDAHFWKFSQPSDETRNSNPADRSLGLHLAGDAFQGGRVEGAWLSGIEAAKAILE